MGEHRPYKPGVTGSSPVPPTIKLNGARINRARTIHIDSRPLQNGPFCTLSASGSNFNPRNIQYIPVVEIFAFLEREQKLPFFKRLDSGGVVQIG